MRAHGQNLREREEVDVRRESVKSGAQEGVSLSASPYSPTVPRSECK